MIHLQTYLGDSKENLEMPVDMGISQSEERERERGVDWEERKWWCN